MWSILSSSSYKSINQNFQIRLVKKAFFISNKLLLIATFRPKKTNSSDVSKSEMVEPKCIIFQKAKSIIFLEVNHN